MNFEVLKKEFVTKAEVKNMLKGKKDLEMEQKLTKEHVKGYKKLKLKQVKKLKKDLNDLNFTKLKDELIVKIIDVMPEDKDDLRVILKMSVIPFTDEEIEKIFECVSSYS